MKSSPFLFCVFLYSVNAELLIFVNHLELRFAQLREDVLSLGTHHRKSFRDLREVVGRVVFFVLETKSKSAATMGRGF